MLNRVPKFILILIMLTSAANSAKAEGDGLYFHSLSMDAGLSQVTVQCIFQDSRGFLWFGTQDGLNRYDGYNVEVFRFHEQDESSISSNYINAIVEDKNGFIWIGTDNGLNYYDYRTGSFVRFPKTGDSSGVTHQKVSALYIDAKERLWVGTEQGVDLYDSATRTFSNHTFEGALFNHRIISMTGATDGTVWVGALGVGLIMFDPNDMSYRRYSHNDPDHRISDNGVTAIFKDSAGKMWVGTRQGLNLYDEEKKVFRLVGKDVFPRTKFSANRIRCLAEDFNKNLLVGTHEGFNVFNPSTGEVQAYNQKSSAKGNLNHFYIHSLLVDRSGTVWIGTFYGGINYYNNVTQNFKFYNPSSGKEYVFGTIGAIVEDDNELWIGTGGGGLLRFDREKKNFRNFMIHESDPTYSANQVRAMCRFNGMLLLSTGKGEILLYDQRRKKIARKFDVNIVAQYMYEDKNGDAWICTNQFNGLWQLEKETGTIRLVSGIDLASKNEIVFPHVRCVLEDSVGIYWIGTRYAGLYRYNRLTGETIQYAARPQESGYLRSNNINTLFIDSKSNLWVGTEGAGMGRFDRASAMVESYCEEDGLLNRNIMDILEDRSGSLWISSMSGISRFDLAKKTFENYSYGNGFPVNEMSNKSSLRLNDGQFVFGGINGFVFFYPEMIRKNEYKPPVVISEFRLFRSKKDNTGELRKQYVTKSETIRLNYSQASFFINYTALNYIFPHNNRYAYKLEGFDPDWNDVDDQRVAIYTNLPAGNYTFRVKASNNDGIWNEEGASLSITVRPPFWQTWWAFLIYLLVMTAVFLSFLKYIRLENKIKLKQLEQQNMENVHQMRIRMFTNFSHELRTPLSLIVGPLEDILGRVDLNQAVKESTQLIYKNAQRLLSLVNQLMDFRKQESGNMKLKAAKGNFSKFSEELALAFEEVAKKKGIEYSFVSDKDDLEVWYDRVLFEKVYFNLLSNAFKFTPDQGRIEVAVSDLRREDLKNICGGRCYDMAPLSERFVGIVVKDNGSGVPVAEREHIFDPFYQAPGNENSSTGTGIGLSLTKGIVELHYGKIWVEGRESGGAEFHIVFPTGPEHLKPEEKMVEFRSSEDISNYVADVSLVNEENVLAPESSHNKHSVLVVEDNKDVRNYIKKLLWKNFAVYEAANGEEGVERAIKFMPDLVISDVMMPKMDGLQLCRKLKNDLRTSHIPIVLLTARVSFQQVKEGFEIGADEYVTKPFSASGLLLKVKSLIDNRERLKKLFERKSPVELAPVDIPSIDDRFLKKVYEIIDQNISDADFNIEKFSEEIGMSRANLYRKIKALTNQSPNEFIKDIRLRIAVKYLRESSMTISEVSYKAGFNSPAYFTNCFKKAYGVSPTEFLERGHQTAIGEKETTEEGREGN